MPQIRAGSGLFNVHYVGSEQQTPVRVADLAQLRATGARWRRRSRGRRKDLKVDISVEPLRCRHDVVLIVIVEGVSGVGVSVYDPHKLWLDSWLI